MKRGRGRFAALVAAGLALAAFLAAKVTGLFRPAEAAALFQTAGGAAPIPPPAAGEAREAARGELAEIGRIAAGKGVAGAFALLGDGRFLVAFGKEARLVSPGAAPLSPTAIATAGGATSMGAGATAASAAASSGTVARGIRVAFEAPGTISAIVAAGNAARAKASGIAGAVAYIAAGGDVYRWDGASLRPFARLGDEARVVSLAVDGRSGDLYCADAASKLVYRYSDRGSLLKIIGAADEKAGIPGFVVPSPYFAIAFSAEGELIAANPGRHGLETYSPDGRLLAAFYAPGADGFSGCCNPACIFLTAEGTILSFEKGVARVREMSREGKPLRVLVAGGEMGFLPSPLLRLGADAAGAFGLPAGSLALLDREAGEVRFFGEVGS